VYLPQKAQKAQAIAKNSYGSDDPYSRLSPVLARLLWVVGRSLLGRRETFLLRNSVSGKAAALPAPGMPALGTGVTWPGIHLTHRTMLEPGLEHAGVTGKSKGTGDFSWRLFRENSTRVKTKKKTSSFCALGGK
jgi:hypothetical protein